MLGRAGLYCRLCGWMKEAAAGPSGAATAAAGVNLG